MKKNSTSVERLLLPLLPGLKKSTMAVSHALLACSLTACAFTEYGNRINREQLAIARLEEKRHSLETQYIIVLNSLELHPTDEKLTKERDEVRKKLLDLSYDIGEKRKLLDQSLMEWEQKIVQERIEQEMVDKEVQENQFKDEQIEFENK